MPLPAGRSYPDLSGLKLPEQLVKAIRGAYQLIFDLRDKAFTATGGTLVSLSGTHATRVATPPVPYAAGSRFVETDRGNVEYENVLVAGVKTWQFLSGTMRGLQANLPVDLGINDRGFQFDVTDFAHVLIWGGTGASYAAGWSFVDPADMPGRISSFLVDPSPTTGWHLCDGTAAVLYLKSDGSTGTQNLPDLTSAANKAAYLKMGSPASATVNAAVAPTASGGGGTVNSNTTGVTIPANTGSSTTGVTIPANTGNNSASVAVQSGAGTTVAASPHTHPEGPTSDPGHLHTEGPVTDPGHTHTFTPTQPTITATGEPANLILRPWFRQ